MEELRELENLKDLTVLLDFIEKINKLKQKRKRTCIVRRIHRNREKKGYYQTTFLKIKFQDPDQFFIHTRMNVEWYNFLLNLLSPALEKRSIRKPISPECRYCVTLTYLSQGISLQYLASSFIMGKETVRAIILETCEAIWTTLSPLYVSEPTHSNFRCIATDFLNKWNMPNCIGSIDGKHIAIRRPRGSGAEYFNHKDYYSIVLIAACDSKYTFSYVDVGVGGRKNDSDIFKQSTFGKRLLRKELPLPEPKLLPGTTFMMPHFFIANSALPLAVNIMKPYVGLNLYHEKEFFNKKISRTSRTIENSFGILAARWQILLNTIHFEPENAGKVILACIALHNFIMSNDMNRKQYCPPNFVDYIDCDGNQHSGEWKNIVTNKIDSIQPSKFVHRYDGDTSTNVRNKLCDFINGNL